MSIDQANIIAIEIDVASRVNIAEKKQIFLMIRTKIQKKKKLFNS